MIITPSRGQRIFSETSSEEETHLQTSSMMTKMISSALVSEDRRNLKEVNNKLKGEEMILLETLVVSVTSVGLAVVSEVALVTSETLEALMISMTLVQEEVASNPSNQVSQAGVQALPQLRPRLSSKMARKLLGLRRRQWILMAVSKL